MDARQDQAHGRFGDQAAGLLSPGHSGALADEVEGVIAQVIADSHKHDLPVFLEPMSYSLDANVSKESAEFARSAAGRARYR